MNIVGEKVPSGHICNGCGRIHIWPDYVYTNWNTSLESKCPGCGLTIILQAGVVSPLSFLIYDRVVKPEGKGKN